MRHFAPRVRHFVVAGLMTGGAAVGSIISTTPALASPVPQSFSTTLDLACKYPIVGVEPLRLQVSLQLPWAVETDRPNSPFDVDVRAQPGGDFADGISLIDDLGSFGGEATLTTTVNEPGGGTKVVKVPLVVPAYRFNPTPDPIELVATGAMPELTFTQEGTASIVLDEFTMNLEARDSAGKLIILPTPTRDINNNVRTDSDRDVTTFDVTCRIEPGQDQALATFEVERDPVCECGPPVRPTNLVGIPSLTSVALSWTASTDSDGTVVGYNVYQDGTLVDTVTGTSATVYGLTPDTQYEFYVEAIDDDGATVASAPIWVTTAPYHPDTPPTVPTVLTATRTSTTATLNWVASGDDVGVVGYDVYVGSTLASTVTGTTATISGLDPNSPYVFKVVAKDTAGNVSSPATVSVGDAVIIENWIDFSYALTGSASLKTVARGTLPLRGGLEGRYWLPNGDLTADLALQDSLGRLTALGFLPVTARFAFVASGETTGRFSPAGELTTSSLVRVKVKEVKLFGAIPLAGGNNCQTKQLSRIDLKSTASGLTSPDGATLTGTFAMSDLNGCGVLNGLVSPLTAGTGNTITLKLANG